MSTPILYCHCAYAKVVPKETKQAVLAGLNESGVAFEAVPDLCEMAARKDPALERFAGCGKLKIAACYPRAVKWLFHGAGFPLPEAPEDAVEVLNMRTESAADVLDKALDRKPLDQPVETA